MAERLVTFLGHIYAVVRWTTSLAVKGNPPPIHVASTAATLHVTGVTNWDHQGYHNAQRFLYRWSYRSSANFPRSWVQGERLPIALVFY